MKEYRKIPNIFLWNAKYNCILGYNETAEVLKNIQWIGTEKIDGTNVRIYWDGHTITWAGHTEKTTLPANLNQYLQDKFGTKEMEYVFEQLFEDKEAYLFGEGYGYKIQKDGEKYVDGQDCGFILFEVQIDGWDLSRENVDDIAHNIDVPSVPVVFEGTLGEAQEFVAAHHMSTLGDGSHEMEGLVLEPAKIQLYDKRGHMIKFKCKYQDLVKGGKISK